MQRVDAPRGVDVHRVVGVARVGHREVEADAEAVGAAGAQLLGRHPVGQEQVVRGDEAGRTLLAAGRVVAGGVAEEAPSTTAR